MMMTNVFEGNVMVNSINDANNFKVLKNADNRLTDPVVSKRDNQSSEMTNVNLSDAAKQIAALKEYAMKLPEINRARVEFLRQEIASGNYQMSSQLIADKMFNQMQTA